MYMKNRIESGLLGFGGMIYAKNRIEWFLRLRGYVVTWLRGYVVPLVTLTLLLALAPLPCSGLVLGSIHQPPHPDVRGAALQAHIPRSPNG
jgi:hypothetical protein